MPQLTSSDPHAPRFGAAPWSFIRHSLTGYDRSKVSIARGFRNALGVVLPLVAGVMTGRIEPALVAATGALNVGFADSAEAWHAQGRRMIGTAFLVAAAIFCGALAGWTSAGAVVAAAVWAFGAGLLVALGYQAGNIGVISACVVLIFAAHPLPFREAFLSGVVGLAGGLLQVALSLVPWPWGNYEPERHAMADLYISLAHSSDERGAPPSTGAVNAAVEALAARRGDHRLETERYRSLLEQAERTRACLLTLRTLRCRVEDSSSPAHASMVDHFLASAARTLETIGGMLGSGKPWRAAATPVGDVERRLEAFRTLPAGRDPWQADILVQMDALTRQLRVSFDLANHATPEGSMAFAKSEAAIPWQLRVNTAAATLRANLNFGSTAFRHAVRLAVCVAAAEGIGRYAGWPRPYWFPLTVTVVLKPDFSSTFSRGFLRLAGTFAGLLLATFMFHLLPRNPAVEIGLIFAATFVLRWVGPAHYGILALSVSQLVVLLVALTGIDPGATIAARAGNTALGGALALLAYWLWPTWERTQSGETFARMLDSYRVHFDHITAAFVTGAQHSDPALNRSRTAARLARTNFQASVDRLSAEPGTTVAEGTRWHGMLATSYVFAHAVIALHAMVLAAPEPLAVLGRSAALREFISAIDLALESLAATLRGNSQAPFPDLRLAHYRLIHSGEPISGRYTLIGLETDRMVNSLNTLRDQIARNPGAAAKSRNAG